MRNAILFLSAIGTNGVQNSWLRFFYKDYLCVQVLYSNSPYNVYKEFLWDPTEPVTTRPLWFKYAGKNLFYAHDGNNGLEKKIQEPYSLMLKKGLVEAYLTIHVPKSIFSTVKKWDESGKHDIKIH